MEIKQTLEKTNNFHVGFNGKFIVIHDLNTKAVRILHEDDSTLFSMDWATVQTKNPSKEGIDDLCRKYVFKF